MSEPVPDNSDLTESRPTMQLADIADVFTDGNWIESKDQAKSGIRLVQTGNVGIGQFKDRRDKARFIDNETFERLKCFEVLPGDILISRLPDPVGRACIIPDTGDKMITAVDCSIIRANENIIDTRFLTYFTQTSTYLEAVDALCTGTTRRRISRKNLGKTPIPVPALDEQKRIVAVLDQAFAALDRARSEVTAYLANSRELFDASLRQTLESVASADPTCSLDKVAVTIVDCEHKTAPKSESGYPSIRTPNIGRGELLLDDVNYVDEESYKAWTRRATPQPGDLIMAREAPAGNVGVIPEGKMVCLGQRTLLIKIDPREVNSSYLAFLLLHPILQRKLLAKSSGATVTHVNMKDIRALPVPDLPELTEQARDAERLRNIAELAERAEAAGMDKLREIETLRQGILRAAFSGQLI